MRWEGLGRLISVKVNKGGQGLGDHVFFSFCIAVNCPFMTGAQWFLLLFLCSFLALFVSFPSYQALLVHRNCCSCCLKLFQRSRFWSLLCGFPRKRETVLILITLQQVHPISYITIGFLGQLYPLGLLICDPHSFLINALMLVTPQEPKERLQEPKVTPQEPKLLFWTSSSMFLLIYFCSRLKWF